MQEGAISSSNNKIAAIGAKMEVWDKVNEILMIINDQVLMTILGVVFGIQIIYILLFFLKAKVYPKADVNHKFGIVIPARN